MRAVADVSSAAPLGPPGRGGVSLRWYVAGQLLLFTAVVVGATLFSRAQAVDEVREAVSRDAQFAADLAAKALASGAALSAATVEATAQTPGLAAVFSSPSPCSLRVSGPGPFHAASLDVIGPDGAVACSSDPTRIGLSYAGKPWLGSVLAERGVHGPVTDAGDGPALAISAPIAGGGAVVAFLGLVGLGEGLGAEYGGPRGLELVVTNGDLIVARSIDPDRWAAVPMPPAFGSTASAGEVGPDVTGIERIYGSAAVPELGWTVQAGAELEATVTGANERALRTGGVLGVGLAMLLGIAFLLQNSLSRSITRLSRSVRAATADPAANLPAVGGGPAEIRALSADFDVLVTTVRRQLTDVARLATLVESSPDAIVSTTPAGTVTTWNPGAERILGWPASEAIGRDLADLVEPGEDPSVPAVLSRIAAGGGSEQRDDVWTRADGTAVEVALAFAALRENDVVTGAMVVARDLTEQRAWQSEQKSLEDRLARTERLESLGQLAGGIAHDFNNLLSIMINYAEFALEDLDEGSPARSDIEEIRQAGERAARLTGQLLLFGRRDTGATAEPLDVNMVVADVHNLLARSIGEHVTLDVYLADQLPAVRIDRSQLEQILLNLAVNARDAMPDGGTLSIETRTTTLDSHYQQHHPGSAAGDHVEIAVSDTGTGMSSETAARAFEPFFTTKSAGEGTGLGLATIYGIVAKAGGHIELYTELGIGTTFRILLPALPGEMHSTTAAVPATDQPVIEGTTILVVEDEPAIMDLTTKLLERNGYTVLQASTGGEALEITRRHHLALLLTDSVMPQMSGQLLAERARKIRPELPVLFMSGYSRGVLGPQPATDEDMLLQKPFTAKTLIEKVNAAIARQPGPPSPQRREPE